MGRRRLGLFDITCLGLNCVIGSGIFLSPGQIALSLGSYAPAGFLLGALLCMTLALCFAEMASRFGATGGAYLYAREAFGDRPGFLVGFVMWLSGVIGGATVAVGFGDTLGLGRPAVAAIILLLALANFLGARTGALTNNLLTLTKMVPLAALALYALATQPWARLACPPASSGPPQFLGFLLVLYAFSGFEEIALPAGEVEQPQRDVPRAIVLVLGLATVLYLVLQGLVGSLGLAGHQTALQDAAAAAGLPLLHAAVVAAGLASLASINAAIAFTCPRSLWALARDGWMPSSLALLHPRFGSPARCVLISSSLTLALALSGSFTRLVELSVLVSLLQYLSTVLAVLRLRGQPSPWRVPLPVPVLGLGVCLLLLFTSRRGDLEGLAEILSLALLWSLAWKRPGPSS